MKKYIKCSDDSDVYAKYGDSITPLEFAKRYFKDFNGDIQDITIIHDLYDYMEEHPEEDYWDYDVDDYEPADDVDAIPVVLVEDMQGDTRLFETVPTPNEGV